MFNIFRKKPQQQMQQIQKIHQSQQMQQVIEKPKEQVHHPNHQHETHQHQHETNQQPQHATPRIAKDMTIASIVQKYPEVVEPLTSAGVHCVGCHVSPYETLEQGLLGHGMNQEAVAAIVSKLNEVIQNKHQAKKTISLTEAAAKKIQELSKSKKASGLRVSVSPGGCSGFQYEFELENKEQPNDIIIEQENTKIFIQPETMEMIKGSQLDYLDTLQGAGFKIQNPQAKSTCGCGSSFS